MPETSAMLVAAAVELNIKWPTQTLPIDKAINFIREILGDESNHHFDTIRTGLAVWLFQKFTQINPTILTVITTLATPELLGSQYSVMQNISLLIKRDVLGRQKDDQDRLRLRTAISTQIEEKLHKGPSV